MIGLATCGDRDCFVIGDPRLAAPLPQRETDFFVLEGDDVLLDPLGMEDDAYALATDTLVDPEAERVAGPGDDEVLEGPELSIPEDTLLPRLWVDTEDLQIRRIDRASGVFTIFGPVVSFDRLMVPAWFEIHEPGAEPIRFEVDRAVQVNAPPKAFSRKWLLAPVGDGLPAATGAEAPLTSP